LAAAGEGATVAFGESLGTVVAEALDESVAAGVTDALEDSVGAGVTEAIEVAIGSAEALEDSVGAAVTVGTGDIVGATDSVTFGETLASGFSLDDEQAIMVIVIKAMTSRMRKRFIELIPPKFLILIHSLWKVIFTLRLSHIQTWMLLIALLRRF
jgi:hypothetical protein